MKRIWPLLLTGFCALLISSCAEPIEITGELTECVVTITDDPKTRPARIEGWVQTNIKVEELKVVGFVNDIEIGSAILRNLGADTKQTFKISGSIPISKLPPNYDCRVEFSTEENQSGSWK